MSSKILIVATAGNQGQLSPHRGLQGRTLKLSENFHSNLALQVILKIVFQGQPTEYILFSGLLYIFKMFSHVVCGSPCILLPGPLKH